MATSSSFPGRSEGTRPQRDPRAALQVGAVPAGEIGGCTVAALQEGQQFRLGIVSLAYLLIGKDKLPELPVKIGRLWRHSRLGKSLWGRVGVGIEGGEIEACPSRPEAGRGNLMAVGFPRHLVRKGPDAARVQRRRPS